MGNSKRATSIDNQMLSLSLIHEAWKVRDILTKLWLSSLTLKKMILGSTTKVFVKHIIITLKPKRKNIL